MSDESLCYLSAVELAAAVRARTVSPVEITRAVLERIDRLNPVLNAFSISMAEEALASARQAEAAVLAGRLPGPLHGVPVSIKDILYVKDYRTTFGSKLHEHTVTREDAPAVERLRRAGAILIGRTTTPEFGWKGVTDSRVFGISRNPWNPALTPGGSSGGAAAAVATGLGPIGIGTDGGGSIRIPASFCGVVGLKASFGRVPNYPAGAVDSVRHTGPLTRTVADAALTLNVLAGPDERDPASLPTMADFLAELDHGIRGLRIAYTPDLGYARVEPEVAQLCHRAANRFPEAGAVLEAVALPWNDPYECWSVFFYGGIAASLADKLADRGDQLDPGLRELATERLSLRAVDYVNALLQRNAFWQKVRVLFEQFDLLLTPTLAVPPFPVGQDNADPLPGRPSRPLQWTQFTYPFNLTGQPVISVPCGWTKAGLPVGLQIIGRRFDDLTVLRAARTWEQIQPWAHRHPALPEK
jgi:aspartyl-tRNA(Asn)/glutamyl-tRNA(Gln) amidotransferase subunit A